MLEWNEIKGVLYTGGKSPWEIWKEDGGEFTVWARNPDDSAVLLGAQPTQDDAKTLAQRLQDVLDGREAVSEAVERIVEALEKMRPKTRECAASSPVFTGYDDAMADAILILRSRDWSKGDG